MHDEHRHGRGKSFVPHSRLRGSPQLAPQPPLVTVQDRPTGSFGAGRSQPSAGSTNMAPRDFRYRLYGREGSGLLAGTVTSSDQAEGDPQHLPVTGRMSFTFPRTPFAHRGLTQGQGFGDPGAA